ncbi:hypothetical protein ACFL0A_01560 [Patescibacteria group bacterium]
MRNKAFSTIGIIVIILIIIGGGYFSWQYFGASEKTEEETKNWKIYTNEEYGYEVKYPESFVTATTDCYTYTTEGKLKDEKAVKFYWEEKGMYVHICRPSVWYKNLSWIQGEPIKIDDHEGYVDKFIIRGGGRAYYFIDQDNENSIFIDTFWAYPEGSLEDSDLKPKEEFINKIISTFRFLE